MVDFYTLKMKEIYTQNYPSKNPKSHSNSLNLLKQDFEKLMKPYLAQESMEKWVGYLLNDSKEMNVSVDLASRLASLEKSERGLLEMKSMLSPLATAIDNEFVKSDSINLKIQSKKEKLKEAILARDALASLLDQRKRPSTPLLQPQYNQLSDRLSESQLKQSNLHLEVESLTLSNLGLKDECIILSKQLEDLKEYYDTIPDSEKDVRVSEYVQWIKSVLTLTQQLYACKDIQTNGNFINCSIAGESCEIEMRNSKIIGIKSRFDTEDIVELIKCMSLKQSFITLVTEFTHKVESNHQLEKEILALDAMYDSVARECGWTLKNGQNIVVQIGQRYPGRGTLRVLSFSGVKGECLVDTLKDHQFESLSGMMTYLS